MFFLDLKPGQPIDQLLSIFSRYHIILYGCETSVSDTFRKRENIRNTCSTITRYVNYLWTNFVYKKENYQYF